MALKKTNKQRNPGPAYVQKYLIWRGRMRCNKCNYLWTSRRDTPPGKCAKCGSQNLSTLKE